MSKKPDEALVPFLFTVLDDIVDVLPREARQDRTGRVKQMVAACMLGNVDRTIFLQEWGNVLM